MNHRSVLLLALALPNCVHAEIESERARRALADFKKTRQNNVEETTSRINRMICDVARARAASKRAMIKFIESGLKAEGRAEVAPAIRKHIEDSGRVDFKGLFKKWPMLKTGRFKEGLEGEERNDVGLAKLLDEHIDRVRTGLECYLAKKREGAVSVLKEEMQLAVQRGEATEVAAIEEAIHSIQNDKVKLPDVDQSEQAVPTKSKP